MSIDRIKKFNNRMSRPKFAKGGYVKRKKFDSGGIASNSNSPGIGGPGNPTNTNTQGIGGLAGALGLNAASANIQPGTNAAQLNNSFTGANNAINAQVGLTNTLTPQAQTGVNAQNQVLQNQLDIAQGRGPNPAQAELAQATGQNVANEAALLAGQRGSNANVGLAGRNIALAGTGAQQQSAGQAATLQAQQQIAAQQQAAQLAGNQIAQAQGATTNLNTAQQNEQNILQNANTAANNSAVGMQSNINNVNAQNNQGLLGGLTSGLGAVAGLAGRLFAEGGEVHPHKKHKLDFVHKMTKMGLDHFDEGGSVLSKISDYISGAPSQAHAAPAPAPANIDKDAAMRVQNSFRGATQYADGGPIQENPLISAQAPQAQQIQSSNYTAPGSDGGSLNVGSPAASSLDLAKNASQGFQAGKGMAGPKSLVGSTIDSGGAAGGGLGSLIEAAGPAAILAAEGGKIWDIHPSEHDNFMAHHFREYFSGGGKVPALVSPGEIYLDPHQVEQVKAGADPLRVGQKVPGKAKVSGDSYKNDFVKAELDEGGVVVDRKNVGSPEKARKFVLKSVGPKRHLKRPSKK